MEAKEIHIPFLDYKTTNGFRKKWVYKENCYDKGLDILQKISYAVQDINNEISSLENPHPKDIVYIITLVDWLSSAIYLLNNYLSDGILSNFVFSNQEELEKCNEYLKSLRSFVVAHPLKTDKHPKYGFDGKYICVDVRPKIVTRDLIDPFRNLVINLEGLHQCEVGEAGDYYLFVYSKEDNFRFFYTIACYFDDLYKVSQLYLNKLYELDKYLSKQRLKDWK